eukprot:gene5876-6796_t
MAYLNNTGSDSIHVYTFNGAPLPFRPISGTPTRGLWMAYLPLIGPTNIIINLYGPMSITNYADRSFNIPGNIPMWTFNNTFTGVISKSLILDDTFIQYSIPYPYGIGNGHFRNMTYSIAKIISPLKSSPVNLTITYGDIQGQFNTIPTSTGVSYRHFGTGSLLARIHASDDMSGVYRVVIGQGPQKIDIRQKDLIYGNKLSGYFEVQYQFTELLVTDSIITIWDEADNYASFSPLSILGDSLNQSIDSIPPLPYSIDINDISSFDFTLNNVDVTSRIIQNQLKFKVANIADTFKEFRPLLELYSDNIDREMFQMPYRFEGYYSEDDGIFIIPFTMMANTFTGPIEYKLFMQPFTWDPRFIASRFGDRAILNVTCSNADQAPPFITSIARILSNVTVAKDIQPTFGWKIKIQEGSNGFKYGIFEAMSSSDFLPYITRFDQSNMTPDGDYKITFTLGANCPDQAFKYNITLVDTMGFRSSMSISCSANSDTKIPTIISFDFQPRQINTALTNTTIIFSLTISDEGSGLSIRHIPTIFLTSLGDEIISVPAVIASYSQATATYIFNYTLPYGFGVGGTLVSIYGIADIQLNHLGLSSSDLSSKSLPFFLNTTFIPLTPILESSSPITNLGGPLTVFGHYFGIDRNNLTAFINYYNTSGFIKISFEFFSGTIITLTTDPIPDGAILRITVNGAKSNDLLINSQKPYVEPTFPPVDCPGSPPCSNLGICSPLGCQCDPGWSNSDCGLKIDISEIPLVNDTVPSTKLGQGKVSVIAINELDTNDNIVHSYTLHDWNTTATISSDRNSNKYTTKLDGRETAVTVQIDWFHLASNITFAGETFTMNPSTLKYSISLSNYGFSNRLNRLQVIMEASVTAQETESCSLNESGSDSQSSLNWIKLTVNDNILYIRLISRAEVDGRPTMIKNQLLDSNKSTNESHVSTSLIAFNIPYYSVYSVVDPDFTLLTDPNSDLEQNGGVCSSRSKDRGLSIAAIVAIAVAVPLSFLIVIIYLEPSQPAPAPAKKKIVLRRAAPKDTDNSPKYSVTVIASDQQQQTPQSDHKVATILKARYLSTPDAGDDTQMIKRIIEISLDLGKEVTYKPGDYVSVFSPNPRDVVDRLIDRLALTHDTIIEIKMAADASSALLPHLQRANHRSVGNLFTHELDICGIPSKRLIRALADLATSEAEKSILAHAASIEGKAAYAAMIESRTTLLNLLTTYTSIAPPPLATLIEHVNPLAPRDYSISTSPLASPLITSFVFSVVDFILDGRRITGLCTTWLESICQNAGMLLTDATATAASDDLSAKLSSVSLNALTIPYEIKASPHFHLPADPLAPLVMVGPGTGVAPFVGYLSHLSALNSEPADRWLFFGCRSERRDFIYRTELESYVADSTLTRLVTAFSRESIEDSLGYVQSKMKEHSAALFDLIHNKNGYVYICGDAKGMAMGVRTCILDIIKQEMKVGDQEAEAVWVQWTKEKRYLLDVWS